MKTTPISVEGKVLDLQGPGTVFKQCSLFAYEVNLGGNLLLQTALPFYCGLYGQSLQMHFMNKTLYNSFARGHMART